MPRPKQRTPELRDHVLSVALDLLTADGVTGFTARRLAEQASTSTPAVYELFGDKSGLVRAVFFEGFRMLHRELAGTPETGDPRADVVDLARAYRGFIRRHPELAQVMFSRPFTHFDPAPEEIAASGAVRELVVGRVRRCVDAGLVAADATDAAHVLVALIQGMAAAENAGRLGRAPGSVDRRWDLAVTTLLDGFRPATL